MSSCYIRKLNPENEKYEDPQKYDLETGKNITTIYLKLPNLKYADFVKLTKELKEKGAKYNPIKKALYITKQDDPTPFKDYLPKDIEGPEKGQNEASKDISEAQIIEKGEQAGLSAGDLQAIVSIGVKRGLQCKDIMSSLEYAVANGSTKDQMYDLLIENMNEKTSSNVQQSVGLNEYTVEQFLEISYNLECLSEEKDKDKYKDELKIGNDAYEVMKGISFFVWDIKGVQKWASEFGLEKKVINFSGMTKELKSDFYWCFYDIDHTLDNISADRNIIPNPPDLEEKIKEWGQAAAEEVKRFFDDINKQAYVKNESGKSSMVKSEGSCEKNHQRNSVLDALHENQKKIDAIGENGKEDTIKECAEPALEK